MFQNMKSENWAGIASFTGSLIALFSGDAQGLISSFSFIAAEILFWRKGHTSWGYSAGCAGIGFGIGLLCFSQITANNPVLRATLTAFTVIWTVGGLRYPLEKLGRQKIADKIPAIVSTFTLSLRVPALYSAAFCGPLDAASPTGHHINTVLFSANLLWATADVLLGRGRNLVVAAARMFHRHAVRSLLGAAKSGED